MRTSQWVGEGSGEGPGVFMAVSAQGDLEGDGCAGGPPGPGDTRVQGDSDEAPGAAGLGPDTEDAEGQSPPGSLPSLPNAGEMCPSLLSFWKEWGTECLLPSMAGVRALALSGLGVSLRCVSESSPLPPRTPRLGEVT